MLTRSLKQIKSVNLATRGYATSASSINFSSTQSGVKIASQDSNSPISTLSLITKAGSRFDGNNLGLSHYLKNFSFKATDKRTGFSIIRETELQGGSLSVSNTRDHLIYTAQFFREDAPYFIKLLAQAATKGKYHHYTFGEVNQQVAAESSSASLEAHLLDQAHQVAFRHGLANPVLAQPTNRVTVESIEKFAQATTGADSTLLVANNINADLLVSEASAQFEDIPSTASIASSSTKYFGGESRQAVAGPLSHVNVAFEGASLTSSEYPVFQVLRQILGGSKYVKWGNGSSSLAELTQSNGTQTSAEAFNFSYSDAGLFGLLLSAPHSQISAFTQSALSEVSKLGSQVSEEALKKAITQAKFDVLSASENQFSFNHQIGLQLAPQGAQVSDVISELDGVTAADISKLVKKLSESKPTLAAFGDLTQLPYADQLKL